MSLGTSSDRYLVGSRHKHDRVWALIPEDKIHTFQGVLDNAIESTNCSYRLVAKIARFFLQFLFLVVAPVVRLFTRNMHFALATRKHWNNIFLIPMELMEELKFWRYNITAFNGYGIRPKYSFDYVIDADAKQLLIWWLKKISHIWHRSGARGYIKSKPKFLHFENLKGNSQFVLYCAPTLRHSKVKTLLASYRKVVQNLYLTASP